MLRASAVTMLREMSGDARQRGGRGVAVAAVGHGALFSRAMRR